MLVLRPASPEPADRAHGESLDFLGRPDAIRFEIREKVAQERLLEGDETVRIVEGQEIRAAELADQTA